ncbi:MAG: hypothetical protein CBB68_06495 [Rhodospirillaceae bacterium TMED8]|nr:MAG: hypothetical protein CBB68_06495 [Rhodospirillaceae bacterium TMED8]
MSKKIKGLDLCISRRRFSLSCLITLLVLTRVKIGVGGHPIDDLVSDLFSDKAAAQIIGRDYIQSTRDPFTIRKKMDSLLQVISGYDAPTKKRTVKKLIKHDFITARVVIVNGWVLSETEVTLCTLALTS